jgi:Tol biopolymer transport system component/tRNA A-37 threonylcarbamoyl transferase component Bud32
MSARLDDLKSALIARYDIDREIGHGGMATVYLARDVKHNREVAVKVLQPDLAAALGHERFIREIEIAANLSHPHILPLYDSGEAEGFLYYVMPYVKGETLGQRIEKEGELPVAEAVRIVREVTDALAFAHSQGVVHRDIKPDNIMLSGRHAMVMDFGVAKAVSEATGVSALTQAGVALGTPTYMAPEQATADPHVDHRADIYAVGVVAYELLAGRPPFHGANTQAVLAAHVTVAADPVSKHRDRVPPELEAVIMRCLAKKPADRWQSADEMLPFLEAVATSSGGLTPTSTRSTQGVVQRSRPRVLWMALGGAATLVVIGVFGARTMRDDQLRVSVANVRQVTHSPSMELFPDISDDGREIVYAAGQGLGYHVYVRGIGGGPALGLTEDLPGFQWLPRWGPGGLEIRFVQVGSTTPTGAFWDVMEIPKFGGQARPLQAGLMFESETVELQAAASSLRDMRGGLDSVTVRGVAGGEVRAVLAAPVSDVEISFVVPSPDGSRMAYVMRNGLYYSPINLGNDIPSSLWVTGLDAWSPVRVTPDEHLDMHPTWVGNDRLLFVSNRDGQRDIYLVALQSSGEPAGEPVRVTTGADPHTLSATPDGSLVAYSELRFRSNLYEITLPERGSVSLSAARPLTRQNAIIEGHDRSSDGSLLVFDSNVRGQQDIYVATTNADEPRRVTTDKGQESQPTISPDGSELVFHSTRNGSRDIYLIRTDGRDERQLTGREADGWGLDDDEFFPIFSPDGLHISFNVVRDQSHIVMMMISRESPRDPWGAPRLLADSAEVRGSWAPDAKRLVYADLAGGLTEVTLAGSERRLVDPTAGTLASAWWPEWAADGRIFFRGTSADGVRGVFVMKDSEAEPRLIVRFDDPQRMSDVYAMTVVGNSLVLLMDEKESDIYVMELEY